jgi:hypothetical protein
VSQHCATCGREWDEQSVAYAQAREKERHEWAAACRRSRRYVIAFGLVALAATAFIAYTLWTRR